MEFLLPYSFLGFFFHTSLLNYYICATLRWNPGTRHEGGKYQEQIPAMAKHKLNPACWQVRSPFMDQYRPVISALLPGLFLGKMRHFLKLQLHPTRTLSVQAGVLCKPYLPFTSLAPAGHGQAASICALLATALRRRVRSVHQVVK